VSVVRSRDVVKSRKDIAGTHHPHGIFLAAGPGVRPGAALERLTLLDIAPALLHSLGLRSRRARRTLPGGDLRRGPPRASPSSIAPAGAAAPVQPGEADLAGMDEEGEAAVMERLKSLGYVE